MHRIRTIILLTGLMMGLISVCAHAQTPVDVKPGVAFTVAWDHDGLNQASFRIIIDGQVVKNWLPTDLTKTGPDPVTGLFAYQAVVPIPGLTVGTHTLIIQAYNTYAKADSLPLTQVVNGIPPTAPRNFRIIGGTITVADNGVVTINLETSTVK